MITDPTDSPFRTREQAEHVFAHFRRGAERGQFGPARYFLAEALADSVDVFGAELGGYDRALMARLGGLLDAVEIAVICSWVRRAAHDSPDETRYVVPLPA